MDQVKSNILIAGIDKVKGSNLFWVISFALLTSLAAQIIIPTQPVPFTLQTMIVLLAGAFLGSKNGMFSQITYLSAGIAGLPVYAGLGFGLHALVGPTGGYLISFPIAAFVTGYFIEKNKGFLTVSLSMILGALIIHLFGAAYLSLFFNANFIDTLVGGLALFIIWDFIKIAAAVSIYTAISKKYPRVPL